MESAHTQSPSVVPRSDIPVSSAPADSGLEVRPFLAHSLLGSALSSSSVELAWTRADPSQDVPARSHSNPGLLIVLRGHAWLTGRVHRPVSQGDVVTLPPDEEYGFTAVGNDGLHALHVAFREKSASSTREVTTLESLLERNEVRAQLLLNNPFFLIWRERKLDTERKRAMIKECLRVFADAFQIFLFTRQAMCRDDGYAKTFGEHLLEEIGHNKLLQVEGGFRAANDSILQATSSWFCHQMLTLDNSGKAVVNLVLETAGYNLGVLGRPAFEGEPSATYFDTHATGDAEHKEIGVKLLEGEHPHTYRKLHLVLDSTWDMLDAFTRRVARLMAQELDA